MSMADEASLKGIMADAMKSTSARIATGPGPIPALDPPARGRAWTTSSTQYLGRPVCLYEHHTRIDSEDVERRAAASEVVANRDLVLEVVGTEEHGLGEGDHGALSNDVHVAREDRKRQKPVAERYIAAQSGSPEGWFAASGAAIFPASQL